jgi:ribosomal protein S5
MSPRGASIDLQCSHTLRHDVDQSIYMLRVLLQPVPAVAGVASSWLAAAASPLVLPAS